jgi:site-specific recombinase XerD
MGRYRAASAVALVRPAALADSMSAARSQRLPWRVFPLRRYPFIEFFTATIRNRNTRMAYARAVKEFFDWCEDHHLGLEDIEPIAIAAYIEELGSKIAKPSVKQHLAAIRQLFDYLVTGGILISTPAGSVRGPKYVVTRGKTPVLSGDDAPDCLTRSTPAN